MLYTSSSKKYVLQAAGGERSAQYFPYFHVREHNWKVGDIKQSNKLMNEWWGTILLRGCARSGICLAITQGLFSSHLYGDTNQLSEYAENSWIYICGENHIRFVVHEHQQSICNPIFFSVVLASDGFSLIIEGSDYLVWWMELLLSVCEIGTSPPGLW